MKSFKICLVGAFSVGKSSLVRRFVHEVFDERYITTLGVKIETREVALDSSTVKLVIWDMEGADSSDNEAELVTSRMQAYLRGVSGVLLVADGTRPVTVDTARRLHRWLQQERPGVPVVMLLNKSDLQDSWQLGEEQLQELSATMTCYTTSALSGENVEHTFQQLAQILSEKS